MVQSWKWVGRLGERLKTRFHNQNHEVQKEVHNLSSAEIKELSAQNSKTSENILNNKVK